MIQYDVDVFGFLEKVEFGHSESFIDQWIWSSAQQHGRGIELKCRQLEARARCASGRGGEERRKISGLAVSKIGAEARSHAENAVGQFREKSYPMEVQYHTPC